VKKTVRLREIYEEAYRRNKANPALDVHEMVLEIIKRWKSEGYIIIS
jgi:hypothetical protein